MIYRNVYIPVVFQSEVPITNQSRKSFVQVSLRIVCNSLSFSGLSRSLCFFFLYDSLCFFCNFLHIRKRSHQGRSLTGQDKISSNNFESCFPSSDLKNKNVFLTVSTVIFSIVVMDSSTASFNRGCIVSNSSCNLATSSAVDNS